MSKIRMDQGFTIRKRRKILSYIIYRQALLYGSILASLYTFRQCYLLTVGQACEYKCEAVVRNTGNYIKGTH